MLVTPRAKDDLLAAALMYGAVADEPDVRGQQVFVFRDDLRQVRRAGFFFAFEDELEIGAGRNVRGLEGVERGGDGGEGSFVIAGGTGVDPPFGVDVAGGGECDHAAIFIQGTVAHYGLPGRSHPLFRVERLAIVVCVKDDGASGAGRQNLAIDSRRRARDFQQAGADTALFEQRGDGSGVLANAFRIAGEIGQCEQLQELAEDGSLVDLPPGAGGARSGVRLRARKRGKAQQGDRQAARHFTCARTLPRIFTA
jgi:hypothetical protein